MIQSEREDRERTRITGELHITVRQHAPALLVPQMYGRDAGQPEPTKGLIVREVVAAEGAKCALQHRRRSLGALGDQQRLAIQEEIGRARRPRRGARPFRGARRLGHLQHSVGLRETPRVHRRGQRLSVGFTGERGIKRLETLGGLQQQRCSVAAAVQRERDLTAQQLHLGALELGQRSGFCDGNESECRVERAGLVLGLCRGQRTLSPPRRIGRQLGRPLEKCGRGRYAPRRRARPAERCSSEATSSSSPGVA